MILKHQHHNERKHGTKFEEKQAKLFYTRRKDAKLVG